MGHRAGPKLIYRFISLKILAKFYFCKLNKIILKFISKGIRHRILKTILKKNRVKGISPPDMTYIAKTVVLVPRSMGENIYKPCI